MSRPTLGTRPELLREIHADEPLRDKAATYSVGSAKPLRWQCSRKHHWRATIRSRAEAGTGCPYCCNKKILPGFNDLATRYPAVAAEWHPTRNGNLRPTDVGSGSPQKRWWLGLCGHEWDAEIRSRVRGYGCPTCDGKRVDASNSFAATYPKYVSWWHPSNPQQPDQTYCTSKKNVRFLCPDGHTFTMTVERFAARQEKCPVCCGDEIVPGVNSLADTHPQIASEWDTAANQGEPEEVHWRSYTTRSWRCPKNHTYRRSVRQQVEARSGCPYCANRRVLAGFNDVATRHPDLMLEWDTEMNRDIDASAHGPSSKQLAWWTCLEGHSWEAAIAERVRGTGCPYCGGKRCTVGVDDLATTRADLARQWHPTRNGNLRPTDVKEGSSRSAWWLVPRCGHEWESQIRYRTTDQCLVCNHVVAMPGVNDVAVLVPQALQYFNADLNPGVDLSDYGPGSPARITWQCPLAHTWLAQIRTVVTLVRETVESPCPYCNGARACPGMNDVDTLRPDLVEELDRRFHDGTALVGVSLGSGRRFAWVCAANPEHGWAARLVDRVHHGTGCPDCAAEAWRSAGEDEVADLVTQMGFSVRRAVRMDLDGRRSNFDICVDERRVVIEYNGLYYHCEEMGRDDQYHAFKLAAAQNAGYTLLTVWEDDWANRRSIVERMIAHKLGTSTERRIPARKTAVVDVSSEVASQFLTENHIQGAVSGSIRLALEHADDIVAVLVVRCEGEQATIVRYATSALVSGGFGKLLRALEMLLGSSYPNITAIKTFSDNLISDGGLYQETGFVHDGDVDPDYSYFKGRSGRQHKFNFRRKRFRDDPNLTYDEDWTETELAAANGLRRVWDAGKKRWVKPLAR